MNKEDKRKIPLKNYVILAAIAVVTVIATIYINAWIKTYKINKSEISVLDGVVQQININEINPTLTESNKAILYVTIENDESLESKILNKIKKEEVSEYFYYLNVSDLLESEIINTLKENFSNVSSDIINLPMFIYVKNGVAVKVVDSTHDELNINDLNVLIDMYINNE